MLLSSPWRHRNGPLEDEIRRAPQFQGRFKAVLVDRDNYLLEVCRYVELNPLRASLVDAPERWPWSSYRAHVALAPSPPWLDTVGLHGYLLGHEPRSAADVRRAASRYCALVVAGRDVRLWDQALRQQIYLGDSSFVDRMQVLADSARTQATEVPRAQRREMVSYQQCLAEGDSREQALLRAHREGCVTMTALALELGLSVSRVSRLVARAEADERAA